MPMAPADMLDILLVEDSTSDIDFIREGLACAALPHRLHVVRNGIDAMSFLRQGADHAAAPEPDLMLLDLNLPRMNGIEVLNEVKSDPRLKHIPVIVLSTSRAPADIGMCYEAHANSYVVKPVDIEEFVEAIGTIEQFWLSLAARPKRIRN